MELDELKHIWKKTDVDFHPKGEAELASMLKGNSKSIIDKLKRSVWLTPKGGKRFPELKHNFLKQVIPGIRVILIHDANLVDQTLMLIDQVYKLLFFCNRQGVTFLDMGRR